MNKSILFILIIIIINGCNSSINNNNGTLCTDEMACNYMDEESCLYNDCYDICGGAANEDACGVCGGDGSGCEGSWAIYYDVSTPIAGFQFRVNGVTSISASGGQAEESGFSVSTNATTTVILGFSFSAGSIPAGNNDILTVIEIAGDENNACISDVILSSQNGSSITVEIVDCNKIKQI